MTTYPPIIKIGKNSQIPKTIRLPIGQHVDGSVVYVSVPATADEIICGECQGWGEVTISSMDSSKRDRVETCERCGGGGIITVEQQDEEISDGGWCLPAAETGGSMVLPGMEPPPPCVSQPVPTVAGSVGGAAFSRGSPAPPPSSGMKPDAVATADQSRTHETEARSQVLRLRVPSSSASDRPAGDMPPNALPGTFSDKVVDALTVIAGLCVFAMLAGFFWVMA
jgi:uncharacterized protein YbjQ (UPF0145 family)